MYDLDLDLARQDAVRGLRTLALAIDDYRRRVTETFGINITDLTTLGHLYHTPELGQTELARLLGRTTSSVTSLIDRLEQHGLAERRNDPDDRRRTTVRLTQRGRCTLGVVYGSLHDAFDPIDDVPALALELDRLTQSLLRVVDTIEERKEKMPEWDSTPR